MLIGVCGKSGCGKSTLARLIKEKNKNAIHLEIDKVGHGALKDELVKEKLVKTFGAKIGLASQVIFSAFILSCFSV